ncbi:MAG: hypothetical protein LBT54_00380, partial [Bifidobacteriaceae bacterium]|nr:hypothetical protein [Bifidobacteriaceae bacterium]
TRRLPGSTAGFQGANGLKWHTTPDARDTTHGAPPPVALDTVPSICARPYEFSRSGREKTTIKVQAAILAIYSATFTPHPSYMSQITIP